MIELKMPESFDCFQVIGVHAKNRDALISAVDAMGVMTAESAPYLRIVMPCGGSCICHTKDDVPNKSVLCTCGSTKHWFIKYDMDDMETLVAQAHQLISRAMYHDGPMSYAYVNEAEQWRQSFMDLFSRLYQREGKS